MLIEINKVNFWKLSFHHLLSSKLQIKHNAESSVMVNSFAGILTKHLILKAELTKMLASRTKIKNYIMNGECEEDVSDFSETVTS